MIACKGGDVGDSEAVAQNRYSGDGFGPLLVVEPDNTYLHNRWMLVDHGGNLFGRHILAAADNHIAGAMGEKQRAIVVEVPQIAGVYPAAAIHRDSRLLLGAPTRTWIVRSSTGSRG